MPKSSGPDSTGPDSRGPESLGPTSSGPSGQPRPRTRRRVLGQLAVAVLLAGLGFAVTTQVRDQPKSDYSTARSEDLVELLKSLDSANARLDGQIDDLTRTRNDLQDDQKRTETARREAKERADALAILAGSVGAKGPGIAISISDPAGQVDAAAMLDAIEELRNAGAEAIQVNGSVRVVARTFVVDDDDGLRIDDRVVRAPYLIEAIGDPDTLTEAVRIIGGLVDTVEARGASVDVDAKSSITITALADAKAPEYARPDS